MQMGTGYWVSMPLHLAAKLGIADLIAGGTKSVDDLAQKTGTHAQSLYRLMRALASVGVFAEQGERNFVLTPLAELLRSDAPKSMRSVLIMMGEEHFRTWADLEYSIRTGKPAFDKVFGKPVFEHIAGDPRSAKIFDEAMVGIHGHETKAMLDAYDFSGITTLADVGGGNGSLLTATLQRYPKLRGLLFDRPHVVERAKPLLQQAGVADRCAIVGGSFFESAPSGADAYLMRHIIHDWNNDQSKTILSNIRKVMPANGKLLLVETVIPAGNEPSFAKLLDLNMLVLPGGQERTEKEYRALFDAAKFKLNRIVPTKGGVDVIEALPV
jgi:hypothetical protein